MIGIKRILFAALVILFILLGTYVWLVYSNAKSKSADSHMISFVPITEVFADGWKVSAVAVEYDRDISDSSLSPLDYTVKTDVAGQKIVKIIPASMGKRTLKRYRTAGL